MLIHFNVNTETIMIELNIDEAKEYVAALGQTPGTGKIDKVIYDQISRIVDYF